MASFRDEKNREWKLESNVGTVKRVRELLDVNILDLQDKDAGLLARLIEEPWTLCDILYAACKPQMDAAQVSDAEFAESMGGESLSLAFDALQEIVVNFSVGDQRELLRQVFSKQKEVRASAAKLALVEVDDPRLMESILAKIKRDMRRAKESLLESDTTGSAGSSPGPSA